MKIADHVEVLEIKGMGSLVYLTLTWDKDHLVLVDAGFPGQTDAIVRAMADAGFSAHNITHIILTHQDIDHIGCVLDLLTYSPAAQVMAHVDEEPYIDGRKTPVKLAALLERYDTLSAGQKSVCEMLERGFAARRIPISQTLSDGEILPFGNGIEVIHTPGHTPGHICLLLRESGILVGGDALNIEGGKLTGPNPQHTYDGELALRSVEKAKSLPISGVISYHCGYLQIPDEYE